jgi:hypothetical protein
VSFSGTGELKLDHGPAPVRLNLKGSFNDSRLNLALDSNYGDPTSLTPKIIRLKSDLSYIQSPDSSLQIDTSLSLDFSEFPDKNLDGFWKFQVSTFSLDSTFTSLSSAASYEYLSL